MRAALKEPDSASRKASGVRGAVYPQRYFCALQTNEPLITKALSCFLGVKNVSFRACLGMKGPLWAKRAGKITFPFDFIINDGFKIVSVLVSLSLGQFPVDL